MIDYHGIKTLAKEIGVKATDIVALAPTNDPFYANLPHREEAARWFADLWSTFGFGAGAHLRRVHYRIVSAEEPALKPNGEPYQNTTNDWKYLAGASLAARYLGLIPKGVLVDRRNPDPIINAGGEFLESPYVAALGRDPHFDWGLNDELILPSYSLCGFDARQDYLVEVWIEKTTQNDILVPLARRLGINLVPGTGETSEILATQAVGRAIEAGRPMRIFYVSDFDPGGRSMPVALARKIEFTVRSEDLDLDIQLQPIVLTDEQCQQYKLPRIPLKETEKRAAKFEARFGAGATELDALEALHPGELRRVVEAEVCRYIDPTLAGRVFAESSAWWRRLREDAGRILAAHDVDDIEDRYQEIREQLQTLERDAAERWAAIVTEMEEEAPWISPEAVPVPRPADPVEEPLFDSTRDYLDQIDYYRRWQGRR